MVSEDCVVGVDDGYVESEGCSDGGYVAVCPEHFGVADFVEEVDESEVSLCLEGEFFFESFAIIADFVVGHFERVQHVGGLGLFLGGDECGVAFSVQGRE